MNYEICITLIINIYFIVGGLFFLIRLIFFCFNTFYINQESIKDSNISKVIKNENCLYSTSCKILLDRHVDERY